MANTIKWAERKQIGTEQAAWSDNVTYEVPFECPRFSAGDTKNQFESRMWHALCKRLVHSGPIVGSSYGATSVHIEGVDWDRYVLTVTLSTGIGD